MGSYGLVGWRDLKNMLEDCTKGFSWDLKTHSRVIRANGRIYPTLPKYDELKIGYVKALVRNLEIDKDCARKHLPGLQV